MSKDSPIIERSQFQAIIGTDVLRRLPPTLIDFSTVHLHFFTRCSTNVPYHKSSRSIIDKKDPVFDPAPSISQIACPSINSQVTQKQQSSPATVSPFVPVRHILEGPPQGPHVLINISEAEQVKQKCYLPSLMMQVKRYSVNPNTNP